MIRIAGLAAGIMSMISGIIIWSTQSYVGSAVEGALVSTLSTVNPPLAATIGIILFWAGLADAIAFGASLLKG